MRAPLAALSWLWCCQEPGPQKSNIDSYPERTNFRVNKFRGENLREKNLRGERLSRRKTFAEKTFEWKTIRAGDFADPLNRDLLNIGRLDRETFRGPETRGSHRAHLNILFRKNSKKE